LRQSLSFQVNPDTGLVSVIDTALNFDPGFPGLHGPSPLVTAVAYNNNVDGATQTTLYGFENSLLPNLITIGSVNGTPLGPGSGRVIFVGNTVSSADGEDLGLDIEGTSNTAFAAVRTQIGAIQFANTLQSIDLATGAATSLGTINTPGSALVRDIAVAPVPTVQFSVANFAVNEDVGNAVVTITRTGSALGMTTVRLTTSDPTGPGGATAGSDYTATTMDVTFAENETSKTINIPIINDTRAEGDETINLTLSNVSTGSALGSRSTATITINANDPDNIPPRVVSVVPVSIGFGRRRRVTGFVITFSEDLDPSRAQSLANYSVSEFFRSGRRTVPRPIIVTGAVYISTPHAVTLNLAGRRQFNLGGQITINGSAPSGLVDLAGNLLDGDNNTTPGGNAVIRLRRGGIV
jgi:hypothetical protein